MAVIKVKQRNIEPTIFTASMADIVFLLIVFFVLTYKIEVDKTQVELPETEIRIEVPRDAAYISVDSNGVIRVSSGAEQSVPVGSEEEVVSFAGAVVAENPDKEFVIKADAGTDYRHVDAVIDALKRSRAKVIYLLSDQETVGG